MISLVFCLLFLLLGYLFYGKLVEKIFGPGDTPTPAIAHPDGVDIVPMKTWRAWLVQLLNIAGTGPIFGALMGAAFGPVVFLWIIFGCILGGAVHDYMCGMISERHGGKSIAELSGIYLGKPALYVMRVFTVVLLLLCGTVFITSPAGLLTRLSPTFMTKHVWVVIILAYYILATLLPIDKLIGKLYPIFGAVLIIMAIGIIAGLMIHGYQIPDISLEDLHPDNLPIWPYMFITVACGAISGFHATQSPMVSKCITSEQAGRKVFYGAMVSEGVIALVWAAAGVSFYETTTLLDTALDTVVASSVVYDISTGLLGIVGGALAIIGVVVCPITSGDTAFRAARLILAEWFRLPQKSFRNRLILTVPLLAAGGLLTMVDFEKLWRYFSWSNQTLAMIALWVSTSYLLQKGRYLYGSFLTAVPAAFMSAVSLTYILMAPEGFRLSSEVSYPIGITFAIILFVSYLMIWNRRRVAETGNKN